MGKLPASFWDSITADDVRAVLYYNPETGAFIRRKTGAVAGTIHPKGYINISIRGKLHRAARVAWLYVHGEWPSRQVDHIDGNKMNNAIANLRLASNSQNGANRGKQANNKSGHKGVVWHKHDKRWMARIKGRHIGSFNCPAAASFAYQIEADKIYGEFARHA